MDIGMAIYKMKQGCRLARRGWNGKNMFCYYVHAAKYPAMMDAIKGVFVRDEVPYGAYIAMMTAAGNVIPWLASPADLLAEDWDVV